MRIPAACSAIFYLGIEYSEILNARVHSRFIDINCVALFVRIKQLVYLGAAFVLPKSTGTASDCLKVDLSYPIRDKILVKN